VDDPLANLEPGERQTVDEIVKLIDETLAKGRIHPVVKDVLFLLNDENGDWINDFSLGRLQQLQAVILATDKQLVDAVFDLFKASAQLWEVAAAKKASMVLYQLLEKIVVDKNLMGVVNGDAEFTPGHLSTAMHTIGDEVTNTAPRHGATAPEGSVKADTLQPKRRI
jgi:hypothetical protein